MAAYALFFVHLRSDPSLFYQFFSLLSDLYLPRYLPLFSAIGTFIPSQDQGAPAAYRARNGCTHSERPPGAPGGLFAADNES